LPTGVEEDGDVEVEGDGNGDLSSGAELDEEPDDSEPHLQVSFDLILTPGAATSVEFDNDPGRMIMMACTVQQFAKEFRARAEERDDSSRFCVLVLRGSVTTVFVA
jgi:hypothetical protein